MSDAAELISTTDSTQDTPALGEVLTLSLEQ